MKSILEFNLPEDISDFRTAVNANKLYCALWEIQQYVRTINKHGASPNKSTEDVVSDIYEHINDCAWGLLDED